MDCGDHKSAERWLRNKLIMIWMQLLPRSLHKTMPLRLRAFVGMGMAGGWVWWDSMSIDGALPSPSPLPFLPLPGG
jgi:hypothetical protein